MAENVDISAVFVLLASVLVTAAFSVYYYETFHQMLIRYIQRETVEKCIKRTDQALYDGKHQGKNRVVVAG
ncbi:MAG: hypothetical protein SWC96_12385 [Thermodesulfobacteriota bacterium]|nr:hypothetical protein [Thermodesulfobacteriota bacterium]